MCIFSNMIPFLLFQLFSLFLMLQDKDIHNLSADSDILTLFKLKDQFAPAQ